MNFIHDKKLHISFSKTFEIITEYARKQGVISKDEKITDFSFKVRQGFFFKVE